MKFKAVVFTAAAAAIAASVAVAAPPPGKGKNAAASTDAAAAACGPTVSYVLNGTFAAAAGADSFTLTVTHANRHGLKAGKTATIYVDAGTKVSRNGAPAKLTDLLAGDRLNVQARACKKADAATLKLTAKRVNAHAPSADAGTADPAPAPAPAPPAP